MIYSNFYLRFSPLNSLSKNFMKCSRPIGSCKSSFRLKAQRFTLLADMSFAVLSWSHISVLSEIHGLGYSGATKKLSYSKYCSPYAKKLWMEESTVYRLFLIKNTYVSAAFDTFIFLLSNLALSRDICFRNCSTLMTLDKPEVEGDNLGGTKTVFIPWIGLFIWQAFLISISVVFTQPG